MNATRFCWKIGHQGRDVLDGRYSDYLVPALRYSNMIELPPPPALWLEPTREMDEGGDLDPEDNGEISEDLSAKAQGYQIDTKSPPWLDAETIFDSVHISTTTLSPLAMYPTCVYETHHRAHVHLNSVSSLKNVWICIPRNLYLLTLHSSVSSGSGAKFRYTQSWSHSSVIYERACLCTIT